MAEDVLKQIESLAGPVIEASGVSLVELQFRRETRGWVLRLLIDREGGITLKDCQQVSQELSALLDVESLIDHSYTLEVSSPGLDRPLKKEEDFIRFKGKRVRVQTSEPWEGQRNFEGELQGLEEGWVKLMVGSKEVKVPFGCIAKANLKYEL